MALKEPWVDATGVTHAQITPELLRDKVAFTHRGRFTHGGYDETEVDDFLDIIADWAESLMLENQRLSALALPDLREPDEAASIPPMLSSDR